MAGGVDDAEGWGLWQDGRRGGVNGGPCVVEVKRTGSVLSGSGSGFLSNASVARSCADSLPGMPEWLGHQNIDIWREL